jgi:hypothetical protein
MSQIIFQAANGDQVMTGYDRPLNYVHFTVFGKDGDVKYSELDRSDPFSMTANDVEKRLAELGIAAPPDLMPLLRDHEARKVGNEQVILGAPENAEEG